MAIGSPPFYNCPRKMMARKKTIIDIYRQLFGPKLPVDRQYWCMCGPHSHEGKFQSGSELGQLLSAGLIELDQFMGVDIREDIIQANKRSKPDACWVYNDFIYSMYKACSERNFNPGIINADFMSLRAKSAAVTSDIMAFIEDLRLENVMLVCNIMYTNPHSWGGKRPKEIEIKCDDIMSEFCRNNSFKYTWDSGNWNFVRHFYCYQGTGEFSRTVMTSFILYKKAHK